MALAITALLSACGQRGFKKQACRCFGANEFWILFD
ncbi:lipoprotein [Maritalea porphyrae]